MEGAGAFWFAHKPRSRNETRGSFAATDYPAMIATPAHVEPAPRRIRAYLASQKVLDTTRALYVWEWPAHPDVRRDLLIPEGHSQHSRRGRAAG